MNNALADSLHQDLIRVWQHLLEVPALGVNDDFFDLGGHSLISIEMRALLRKALNAPQLRVDVLETPTVASMANSILLQLGAAA